jgi:MoaA/NifB/PqqE/SkfB family radical SAM enzyme
MNCNAPFTYLGLNQHGTIQPCCINSIEIKNKYKLLKDIWFGIEFTDLRNNISQNRFDYYYCNFCFEQFTNKVSNCHADSYKTFRINSNGFPSFLKIAYSNKCNLSCIMCNEVYSSSHNNTIDKFNGNKYYEELDDFIPHLDTVSFSGGEPFLIDDYYKLFSRINQLKSSVDIHITTNGTVFNEKVKSFLNNSNSFVTVSIDSISESVYNKIRTNSCLSKVLDNLQKIKNNCQFVDVNLCVTKINVGDLYATINYFTNNNLQVNINVAKYPIKYSLFYLESKELDKVCQNLKSNCKKLNFSSKAGNYNFLQCMNLINVLESFSLEYQNPQKFIYNIDNFNMLFYEAIKESGKKCFDDIKQITFTIPNYLFTDKFLTNFFKYNPPTTLVKMVNYSNSTIQDFIVSNAFYLK